MVYRAALRLAQALGPQGRRQPETNGSTTLGVNRVYVVAPGPASPQRFFRLQEQSQV